MADKIPELVDYRNQPLRRKELKKEIAGPTLTGVRSPYSGYPSEGLTPVRLAGILREADHGDPMRYFELAEQIEEKDPHYAGVLGTRKRSVSQLEITVDAASEDAHHVAHADMVRDWLDRDELADELFDILDCIGKGVSWTEIIWDTSEGQWRPGMLEWRDPRFFRFDRDDGITPMLYESTGDVPLPAFKFIYARTRAKSGLPIRGGIARIATWSWMFKAFTQRDWAIFTQTYGQPIRIGKYHSNASEEDKDTLFRAVANIAGDCAAIVPEGMMIEFIQTRDLRAGSDLYINRSDWLDQQMSKLVLGQTATTDAIAGGHAVGQEHRQVQEDIERADCKQINAILNRELIRPWIQLEFGPQEKYPRLRIGRPEDKDVKLIVDSVSRLVPMGLRVGQKAMTEMLGLPEPDEGDEILQPMAGASSLPGEDRDRDQEQLARLAAAASRDPDTLDDLADASRDLAAHPSDALIDQVRGLVDNADSLDEVRDQLLSLRPDMSVGTYAGLMRQALAYAELSGRDEFGERDAGR